MRWVKIYDGTIPSTKELKLGKPYWSELKLLPETFAWAKTADISEFAGAIKSASRFPLLSIGSGGSFSAAALAAWFHEQLLGHLALAATPLQAAKLSTLRNCAALIFSAGGKNPDVLGVFKALLKREPQAFGVLCLARRSKLGELCGRYDYVSCTELEMPNGKDGFVATNSLIAFSAIIFRAYSELAGVAIDEKLTLERILGATSGLEMWSSKLAHICEPLWRKPYLIVLHGAAATHAAALDLESKFSEAAIGPIQVTDYRNFAHGRHHWLDKKRGETGVLAIVSAEDRVLADKTLRLLPADIPVARIQIRGAGGVTAIGALVSSLYIAGFAASARGIDPGRPGVPDFGRRIYNLNTWSSVGDKTIPPSERLAIERKIGRPIQSLSATELRDWRAEYKTFISALRKTSFDALVLDYDGTLCDERFRFSSLPADVSKPLNRLLGEGALLGIATGRGKSVHKSLRESIEQRFWSQVVIAYHNGSEISSLERDHFLPVSDSIADSMHHVVDLIKRSQEVNAIAVCEYKANQISIVAKNPADVQRLYRVVCDAASPEFAKGISCVRSSHSVDLLGPRVSKLSLLAELTRKLGKDSPVFLCIGDLGSWPGNDFSLLSTPLSLSANEVSSVTDRCWNLAPLAFRNSQATRFFLQLASVSHGQVRIDCARLLGGSRRRL
jgi:hydroxymethylpyrimidine pyrophosphatase-like HAD family hydrolase/fructoselysine-6-P-deglycase FrlB-like protein